MDNEQGTKYTIHDLADILREFDGFDEGRYKSMAQDPPTPPYGYKHKIGRFFRFLQADKGYNLGFLETTGVRVEFCYYYDNTISSIMVVKGKERKGKVFDPGTDLGETARRIAGEHGIELDHYCKGFGEYTVYTDEEMRNYTFLKRTDIQNVGEGVRTVIEADKDMDQAA